MVWHYTVNLWVDRHYTTVLHVTASEAMVVLGCKPSDIIALAFLQSGFKSKASQVK